VKLGFIYLRDEVGEWWYAQYLSNSTFLKNRIAEEFTSGKYDIYLFICSIQAAIENTQLNKDF
jgi:hypothetical protein